MIVKVGDLTYDSKKEPVMIVLSEKDRENIGKMPENGTMYACFPKGIKEEDMIKWMNDRGAHV